MRATEGLVAAYSAREMVVAVATATEAVGSARAVKVAAAMAAVGSAAKGWVAAGSETEAAGSAMEG